MIAMTTARGILAAGLFAPVVVAGVCIVREDRRVTRAAREARRRKRRVDYSQPDVWNKKRWSEDDDEPGNPR